MSLCGTDTAVVFIDPQNEVLTEKGAAWSLLGGGHRHQGRAHHHGVLDDQPAGAGQQREAVLRTAEGRDPALGGRDQEREGHERHPGDQGAVDSRHLETATGAGRSSARRWR